MVITAETDANYDAAKPPLVSDSYCCVRALQRKVSISLVERLLLIFVSSLCPVSLRTRPPLAPEFVVCPSNVTRRDWGVGPGRFLGI
jgi:hypothetical protein